MELPATQLSDAACQIIWGLEEHLELLGEKIESRCPLEGCGSCLWGLKPPAD